ncbi:uncharacterized protein B0J16DRAFT_379252 [Fusarium flagelliforme]|uniref:uncharacterized protein n=1 Tax=Fusarium flagelliforme TaxID=2675880 RepID=UPI001E8EAF46|nr:uncharacterized protein B0J16DRAFT_379252 [Fusarium flagelliforme]KAH7198808.1 hypothetical protein B0J16DRAFT_379252 [Fusarium flagelliforme]
MTGIQDLPSELLLQIMEHCSSDLLSLTNAYPTALNTFCQNRKSFVARMSARFGDLALLSLVRAAQLHYIRQQPGFEALHFIAIEARITTVCDLTKDTAFRKRPSPTLPNLNGYSLSALSIMWELGEDAKRITDMYSQQALSAMARDPSDEFYIPRQSAELTEDERRRFMTAAFVFESYCLTFFHGPRLLFRKNEYFRESFLQGNPTAIGRFYCIVFYIVQKHRELFSSVIEHIRIVRGRPSTHQTRSIEEEYFLRMAEEDEEDYEGREIVLNYLQFLASQGLNMLTTLQKMSIDELANFTITTFLRIDSSDRPLVLITRVRDHGSLGTQEIVGWMPWAYLDILLDNTWRNHDEEEIWEDTWSRAIPFWDPSEDKDPYGRADSPLYWFLDRFKQ